ncbi:hypothetical protein N665_1120s0005 [Sinapis alba]|nr:hypothetical protein N665_1120s0005 [Sinapis alba]
MAHQIFFNAHKIKFNLHHAWEELRNDQKWCEAVTKKIDGSGKKRKCDDGAQSESSQEKYLTVKERLSKMALLDSLIFKNTTLSEAEEALKQKLITEMLSN